MNSKTLAHFHKFSNAGKILTAILTAAAVLVTALCLAATIYVAALPKDALTVRVTDHAEFQIKDENFASLWGFLADGISYSGDVDAVGILSGEEGELSVPEDQAFQTDLSFFDQSYSSAKIHSEGDRKVIEAESDAAEYRSTDLVYVLAALTVMAASAAVALYLLKELFKTITKRDTPFTEALVRKMQAFGFSLLPTALFATIAQTLSAAFLSAGRDREICIQWGLLVTFAVTMCLVTVFRYGVQLQKESDETL